MHVFGVAMLKSGPKPKRKRPTEDTGKLLLKAAAAEFNQRGYDGTDTNRIARRAGFAPQTFYRWYQDKEAIFIEVYREWQSSEAQAIGSLLQVDADDAALVDACVGYHESYRKFRRSLRQLSYERPRVRAARAESRRNRSRSSSSGIRICMTTPSWPRRCFRSSASPTRSPKASSAICRYQTARREPNSRESFEVCAVPRKSHNGLIDAW